MTHEIFHFSFLKNHSPINKILIQYRSIITSQNCYHRRNPNPIFGPLGLHPTYMSYPNKSIERSKYPNLNDPSTSFVALAFFAPHYRPITHRKCKAHKAKEKSHTSPPYHIFNWHPYDDAAKSLEKGYRTYIKRVGQQDTKDVVSHSFGFLTSGFSLKINSNCV